MGSEKFRISAWIKVLKTVSRGSVPEVKFAAVHGLLRFDRFPWFAVLGGRAAPKNLVTVMKMAREASSEPRHVWL